jgi:hypothetical protein
MFESGCLRLPVKGALALPTASAIEQIDTVSL